MFDYRDLVSFVVKALHERKLSDTVPLHDLLVGANAGTIADFSTRNPFYSVVSQSPIWTALEILGNEGETQYSVHRINVLGEDGRVKGIISQTDICRFVVEHADLFVDLLQQSIEQLGLVGPVRAQMNGQELVSSALQAMLAAGVTSVAIVNGSGPDTVIMGNISMADIRFIIEHGQYTRLDWQCSHFVSAALNQTGLEHQGRDRFPVFDVRPQTSLLFTLQKMLAVKAHHVWIVDERMALKGVAGMTDILGVFRKRCHANAE